MRKAFLPDSLPSLHLREPIQHPQVSFSSFLRPFWGFAECPRRRFTVFRPRNTCSEKGPPFLTMVHQPTDPSRLLRHPRRPITAPQPPFCAKITPTVMRGKVTFPVFPVEHPTQPQGPPSRNTPWAPSPHLQPPLDIKSPPTYLPGRVSYVSGPFWGLAECPQSVSSVSLPQNTFPVRIPPSHDLTCQPTDPP